MWAELITDEARKARRNMILSAFVLYSFELGFIDTERDGILLPIISLSISSNGLIAFALVILVWNLTTFYISVFTDFLNSRYRSLVDFEVDTQKHKDVESYKGVSYSSNLKDLEYERKAKLRFRFTSVGITAGFSSAIRALWVFAAPTILSIHAIVLSLPRVVSAMLPPHP